MFSKLRGVSKISGAIMKTQKNLIFTKMYAKTLRFRFARVLPLNTAAFATDAATLTKSGKRVGYWFLTCGGMVFATVVLGGVTRLTESGLSMVTWKFFGERPPLSREQWLLEFEKYRQFPEFKLKNSEITLEEFKWIWRMEYAHRMMGRLVGFTFFLPAVYFSFRGHLSSALKKRVVVMGTLLLAQGFMGWYMVQSGLEDRFQAPTDMPRVSQYRLACHLTAALVLYAMLLRASLDQLLTRNPAIIANIVPFKILAHSAKGFVFLTAISGAFVAGLDAGLVYNSFPKMADRWIPEDILTIKPFVKNLTENPTTVQFDHRILGTTTVALITTLWLNSYKFKLPARTKMAVNALVLAAYAQVTLGITTLLYYVPTAVAAMHQSGSLILLSMATWLTQELKYIKKIPK